MKSVGIAILGFAVAAMWFVFRDEPGKLVQGPTLTVGAPPISDQQLGAKTEAESPPIASQQEVPSAEDRSVVPRDLGKLPTIEQTIQELQGSTVEIRWLLDAGFSKERIDWLVRRKSELLAQRQQAAMDRKQSGGGPRDPSRAAGELAEIFDDDLLLRDEMSEDEYMKYRQALRRPTAVSVERVLPGSFAEQAGLIPGDQVVRYDGKRVYSDFELNSLSRSDLDGHDAQIEVLRGDQTVMIVVPKGDIGISRPPESLLKDTVRRAVARARETTAVAREPNP